MLRLLTRTLAVLLATSLGGLTARGAASLSASAVDAGGLLKTGATLRALGAAGQGAGHLALTGTLSLAQAGVLASVSLLPELDADNDGLPDELDPDDDNDGIPDTLDPCPYSGGVRAGTNDLFQIAEDGSVLLNVLANDGTNAVALMSVTQPAFGTATVATATSVRFVPPPDASGVAVFTYQASGPGCDLVAATVTVTVVAVNDPPLAANDALTVSEGGQGVVSVLTNDVDPDGDALTVTQVRPPLYGSITAATGGVFTYTAPDNFSGADAFQYVVSDGHGATSAASVIVTVLGSNDSPVALDDLYAVATGSLTVTASGVLANDRDPDGDRLVALLASGPSAGSVSLSTNGGFTYTLSATNAVEDVFTYRASDGQSTSAPVTVRLSIVGSNKLLLAATNLGLGGVSLASGDVNLDVRTDAVLGDAFVSGVNVATNNGAGVYGFATNLTLSGFTNAVGVALADLDGDGDQDLITAMRDPGAVLIRLNTAGALGTAAVRTVNGRLYSLSVGDVDGDGDPDVIAGGDSGVVAMINTGGTLGSPVYTVTAADSDVQIHGADLDGDGRLDAVLGRQNTPRLMVLKGNGDGTFRTVQTFGEFSSSGFSLNFTPYVSSGDLDGDGDVDIVVGTVRGLSSDRRHVQVFYNNGLGALTPAATDAVVDPLVAGAGAAVPLATGDFDGDGDLDVAVGTGPASAAGKFSVLLNAGNGLLGAPIQTAVGIRPSALALADVDRDGDLDALVACEGSSLHVVFNVTTNPVPAITFLSPTNGPAGTPVTITGSNLNFASSVTFGGVTSTALSRLTATQLVAAVPAGALSGLVTVRTPSGTATSTVAFTVTPVPPALASATPGSGPVGSAVTLGGTGLLSAATLTLGGTSASFTVQSATQLIATVPAGATGGLWIVTTADGTATSPVPFVVTAPALQSVGLSATNVMAGATLTGTVRFDGALPTGAVVALNADPAAAVPGSVAVSAAAAVASFAVTAQPVLVTTTARIAAVHAGITQSVALVVRPAGTNLFAVPQFVVRHAQRSLSDLSSSLNFPFRDPVAAAVADVNGDGLADAASISMNIGTPLYLYSLTNRGDAVLGEADMVANFPSSQGFGRDAIHADLNNDGRPDLVSGWQGFGAFKGRVLVSLNDGFGRFTNLPPGIGVFVTCNVASVSSADLDGDGWNDVIAAGDETVFTNNETKSFLTVLRNAGTGVLVNGQTVLIGREAKDSAAGDLSDDGKPDVVLLTGAGVQILFNDGRGVLSPPYSLSTNAATGGGVRLADLDRDGDIDLVAVNQSTRELLVWENRGAAGLSPAGTLVLENIPDDLALADVNGDGWNDVAVCSANASTVAILLNRGRPGDWTAPLYLAVPGAPRRIGAGDFDGDGDPDFLVALPDLEQLGLLLNDSVRMRVPTFAATEVFAPTNSGVGIALFAADMDTNGWADLVQVSAAGKASIHTNDAGRRAFGRSVPNIFSNVPSAVSASLADWGPDGDLDLYLGGATTSRIGIARGDGGLTGAVGVARVDGAGLLRDLDGDGDADLVRLVSQFAPELRLLVESNATGTAFGSIVTNAVYFQSDNATLAAGDLDGDGLPDLAIHHFASNRLSILRNLGGCQFTNIAVWDLGGAFDNRRGQPAVIADLDGDGDADLAVPLRADNVVAVIRLAPGISVQSVATVPTAEDPVSIQAVDRNGDGLRDLLVGCYDGRSVQVLTNLGAGAFLPASAMAMQGPVVAALSTNLDAIAGEDIAVMMDPDANSSRIYTSILWAVPPAGPRLAGIVLSADSVSIGSQVGATVSLDGPAPAGGAVILLGSSQSSVSFDTNRVTHPSSVLIPVGQTSAVFTVSPGSTVQGDRIVMTATYGADSASASLYVDILRPQALQIVPPSMIGGLVATGTVVLNGPAPVGGMTFNLANDQSFGTVTLPITVTVPAGATNASFNILSSPVAASIVVRITATHANGTVTNTCTLVPVPGNVALAATNAGWASVSFVAGDVDGNGTVDAVLGSPLAVGVGLATNNGAGFYGAVTNLAQAGFTGVVSVALADLNGDGAGDLILAMSNPRAVLVRLQTGGTFAAASAYATGAVLSSLSAGDVDGDGDPDVIALSTSGVVAMINTGGTLGSPVYTVTAADSDVQIHGADLDGDGRLDVVLGRQNTPRLMVLKGNGDGTFRTVQTFGEFSSSGFSLNFTPYVSSGDLDGDGDVDIVVGTVRSLSSDRRHVQVFYNNGLGALTPAATDAVVDPLVAGAGAAVPLATGDFDGDGDLDVAVGTGPASAAGKFSVLLNAGNGLLGAPIQTAVGIRPSALALADVDRDGDLDALVACEGSSLHVVFNVTTNPVPAITFLSPTNGPAGTPVTITGSNLNFASSVTFGGVTSTALSRLTATQLVAAVPAGALSGLVTVRTPSGTATSTVAFTVTPVPPALASATPGSGPVGSAVTLGGTGLLSAATLTLGGTSASFTVQSATQLIATVPAGATGGLWIVTTADGTATSPAPFTVTAPALLSVGLSATNVMAGATLTGTVRFDGALPTGAVVALNADPAASVPGSVAVSAAAAVASFAVTAQPVLVTTTARIAAVHAGITQSVALVVRPAGTNLFNAPQFVVRHTGAQVFETSFGLPFEVRSPVSISAADLNGDGLPDLAAMSESGFEPALAWVITNRSSGVFGEPQSYSMAPTNSAFGADTELADMNGDGRPDLVLGWNGIGQAGGVKVRINNGAGLFVTNERPSISLSGGGSSLAVADVDQDGRSDVLVAGTELIFTNNMQVSLFAWLRNTGTGSLALAQTQFIQRGGLDVVAADFNGDGRPDCAVLSQLGVELLYNTGGGFSSAYGIELVPVTQALSAGGISAGDLDGDGDPDLVAAWNSRKGVTFYRNVGGTLTVAGTVETGTAVSDVELGDVDGDGRPDLIVCAQADSVVSVLLNLGGGQFGWPVHYAMPGGPVRVTAADLDGDGDLDIATANKTGSTVGLLWNDRIRTPGALAGSSDFEAASVAASSGVGLDAGDVNGDGWNDLLVTMLSSNPVLHINRSGSQQFASSNMIRPVVSTPSDIRFVDHDTDGDLDVAAIGTTIQLATNAPGLRFTNFASLAGGPHAGFADLDGDGDQDLAVLFDHPSIAEMRLQVSSNSGTGIFGAKTSNTVLHGVAGSRLAFGDVSGDGLADIVIQHPFSNAVSVAINLGGCTFATSVTYAFGVSQTNLVPRPPLVADVDGDGDLDIVTAHPGDDAVRILLNATNGVFTQTVAVATADDPRCLAWTDLTGDGRPDLIVGHYASRQVLVFTNAGGTAFALHRAWTLPGGVMAVKAAQLDGVPGEDLAVLYDAGRGFVTVFWNEVAITQRLFSLTLSTNRIAPIGTATATVTIDRPAPASGAVVHLTSSDSNAGTDTNRFTHPDTVTIAAGQTSATFIVSSGFNIAGHRGVIGARLGADYLTASLLVDPIRAISLTFAPASVTGGQRAVGTISLNAPAPFSGIQFNLSHDQPFGRVIQPLEAIVPVFKTQVSFTTDTRAVSADVVARIVASHADGVVTGLLPILAVPGTVAFTNRTFGPIFGVVSALGTGPLDANASVDAALLTFAGHLILTNNSVGSLSLHGANTSFATDQVGFAVADIDGDGDLDTASGAAAAAGVVLRTNDGSGNFDLHATLPVGPRPVAMVFGSFNSHVAPDLAIAFGTTNALMIFTNNGTGGFSLTAQPGPAFDDNAALAAGDVNGDGLTDLVVARPNNNNEIRTFLAAGDGTFTTGSVLTTVSRPAAVRIVELTGDTNADLAVAFSLPAGSSRLREVRVLQNLGGGTWSTNLAEVSLDILTLEPPVSGAQSWIAAADLDGDGDLDLALANGDTRTGFVSVVRNAGNGLLSAPITLPTAPVPVGVEAFDADGDGDQDLLVAHQGGQVILLRNLLTNLPPVTPAALVFSPASVIGGLTATGTLQTTAPGRPEAPTTFAILPGSGLVTGPVSVILAHGATSAAFVVQSAAVFSTSAVPVTVTNAEGAALAVLTLLPGDLDGDGMLDAWELLHFAALTNATAATDSDGDGVPDAAEYIADTAPTNGQALLRAIRIGGSSVSQIVFPTATSRVYTVDRTTNLLSAAAWQALTSAIDIPGSGTNLTVTATNDTPNTIYRIRVRIP